MGPARIFSGFAGSRYVYDLVHSSIYLNLMISLSAVLLEEFSGTKYLVQTNKKAVPYL